MPEATQQRICVTCSDPIDPGEDPHFLHEPDCTEETCSCDRPVHPDCCPEEGCR